MARELLHPAQFTVRIAQSIKDEFLASAEAQNIDGMSWIRQAITEKLEREKEGGGFVTKAEVKSMIAEAMVRAGVISQNSSGSGDNNMRFG